MNEQILKQLPLFASLPASEVKYLAEILHLRELSAGTVFIQESEIADHFFILLEGRIEVVKALGTANERVLGVDEAGSFDFGHVWRRPRLLLADFAGDGVRFPGDIVEQFILDLAESLLFEAVSGWCITGE